GIESSIRAARCEVALQLREVDQAVLDVILVFPRVTCVALDIPGRIDLMMDAEADLPAVHLSLEPDRTDVVLEAVQYRERTAIVGDGILVERVGVGNG